ILNPANGDVIAQTVDGNVNDVKVAIQAARSAFDKGDWVSINNAERSNLLMKIAGQIEKKIDKLAELEMLDNGKPFREAKIDVQDAADCFRYYASIIRKSTGKTYNTSTS